MKRLISTMTAVALLAGALLLPAMLRAEDKKDAKDEKAEAHEHGGRGGKFHEKLGLTEEQEGKLKTLKRSHREAEEASRSEMKTIVRKLEDQLEDKAPEKELSATLDKIKAQHKKMAEDRDKFMESMAQVLTPTQRAKMVVAMSRHMGGGAMHGRGGMRGHGKMGGEPHGEKEPEGPGHDDDD